MCSVAMNFSKFAICFIVRVCVRASTVSSEHATSGATTYSFASTSGGAHGRIETGGAGAGCGTAGAIPLDEFPADEAREAPADERSEAAPFGGAVEAGTILTAGDSAA